MNRLLINFFCVLALSGCMKGTSIRNLNDNHSNFVVWSCESEEKFKTAWRCYAGDSDIASQEKFKDRVKFGLDTQLASLNSVKQEEHLGGAPPEIVWTIQFGAYSSRDAAVKHRDEYVSESSKLWLTNSVKQQKELTLLLYGKFGTQQLAQAAVSDLRKSYPNLEYWVRMVKIDGL